MRNWPYFVGILLILNAAYLVRAQWVLHAQDVPAHWVGAAHDRNAHYRYGLELAADIRNADIKQFFIDFDAGSWVWPPLHGIIVAITSLIFGSGPGTAFAPGLLGYFLCITFGVLLSMRLMRDSAPLMNVTPFVVMMLLFGSPALRAYSTDVMLENLGVGLTMATLFAYVVWEERRTRQTAAWLGFSLTLLFLTKYNYWLLALIPIVLVHLGTNRIRYYHLMRRFTTYELLRWFAHNQVRRPLNYAILVCGLLTVAVQFKGGFTVNWQGQAIPVETSRLFVAIGFALLMLRITIWWWTGGRHIAREWLMPQCYPLLYWHIFPVCIWFLIPYRLSTFLWFISPANTEREYHASFVEGLKFYWNGAANEYMYDPVLLPWLAAGIPLALLFCFKRDFLPRGAWVVPLFAIIGLFLTVKHPNHKLRFLHTVMPVFMLAGVLGWMTFLRYLLLQVPDRPRRVVGIAILVLFFIAFILNIDQFATQTLNRGYASEAGLNGQGTSLREITGQVQPQLRAGEPVAIFSNIPAKFWAKWLYLERFDSHTLLQVDCREVGVYDPPTQEQFNIWCKKTKTEKIIVIDVPKTSPLYEDAPEKETNATIAAFLPNDAFRLQHVIQDRGVYTIYIYQRATLVSRTR